MTTNENTIATGPNIEAVFEKLRKNTGSVNIYVIYSASRNTIAYDTATKLPVHSTNRQMVEHYLKRIRKHCPDDDGEVMTENEAMKRYQRRQN